MFKITNMRFTYPEGEEGNVEINWNANFADGSSANGVAKVTITEFSSVVTGLNGYAELVKDKVVDGFEAIGQENA